MFGKNGSFKSVASASSNLTIVFPNVVDTSLDITNAIMVTKAQERKCVSMLEMLFSAYHVTDAKNAMDYISKFHTNLRMDDDITIDKFIGYMDDLVDKMDESAPITVDKDLYNAVKEDMKNLGYYLNDTINEMGVNNYRYSRLNGGHVVQEAPAALGYTPDQDGKTAHPTNGVEAKAMKDLSDYDQNRILDRDIKKANELMPTMMIIHFVNFGATNDDKVGYIDQSIIGVKVKMYPASPTDIIDRITAKNEDGNGLNKFIRATTREISFWKDFIFAVDKAKLDAISASRRGSSSPIWKLLERRALKSRIRRSFRFTNDATAITTLTLSSNTVEYLLKMRNINLRDERVARKLMEAFNLMSIVEVNEALESAAFIYDTGDDLYETLTFSSLERESSDNTYKKVVNLISKIS
jgi:hypothetical protein